MSDDRFARQLPLIGASGQERLGKARILIVGLGGLGSPAALYLAGAGIGTLGLMDPDRVELSNLHRQPLYAQADVGRSKVDAASDRLLALEPRLTLRFHPFAFTSQHAGLLKEYDLVLSCTDDVATQYALNDACQQAKVPLVHAAVAAWEGELAVFLPDGPCLRCLRPAPTPAPSCAEEGVLGPIPGVLGTMQALEAIKLVLGGVDGATRPADVHAAQASPKGPQLLLWDGRTQSFDGVALKRRKECLAHVERQEEQGPACPMPWNAPDVTDIPVHELAPRLDQFFLLDVREPEENEEVAIPGSHLIPLGELTRRLQEVPKDRPIAVYCAVGGRSARAVEFLRARGYQAVNVRGGMRAWWMMTHR